jgi:hypothetical protein
LQILGGVHPEGGKVEGKVLREAFGFTKTIYELHKEAKKFTLLESASPADIVGRL